MIQSSLTIMRALDAPLSRGMTFVVLARRSRIAMIVTGIVFTAAGLCLLVPADGYAQLKQKRPPECGGKSEPVCARTSLGQLATYENRCYAEADGAKALVKGSCISRTCNSASKPVCASREGKNKEYANSCLAENDGAMVIKFGTCPQACTMDFRPVCGVNEKGARAEFSNACAAQSAGSRVLHPGKCLSTTNCAADGVRVCAYDVRIGRADTFANQCAAEIVNATYLHRGKCDARWRKLWNKFRGTAQASEL
jgi:hypothetical protein